MHTTHVRINGMLYAKTTLDDGTESYDPPLPSSVAAWFERGRQDIRDGHSPKLKTDTTWHSGRKTIREQFKGDERYLKRFSKEYRKQTGRDLPVNGVWMGQLADSAFDAKAVIEPGQGQAEVNKLIERRASQIRKENSTPPVRLAEDLVQSKMAEYRAAGDTSKPDELRHMVIEKHGAPA